MICFHSRVGLFGHSFGGATALQFCSVDSRCKAGIDIGGAPVGSVIQTGVDRPFMFLLSDHGDLSTDAEARQIMANLDSIYARLPPDRRLRIIIRGANHFTFSDDGALLKSHVLRGLLRLFGKLGIDGRRQLELTAYCVHSFFDASLKGGTIASVKASSARATGRWGPDRIGGRGVRCLQHGQSCRRSGEEADERWLFHFR